MIQETICKDSRHKSKIQVLNDLIPKFPNHFDLYYERAVVYYFKKNPIDEEKAKQDALKYLELSKGHKINDYWNHSWMYYIA